MFHWELSSLNFHIPWGKTHMFQTLGVSSISEEHYSKTTIYRINVYAARHSAGNVIKMKEGKMCWNTIQM